MGERIYSGSEAETERIGAALGAALPDSAVVALYGDLGAGKTAFVRGLARGMGLSDRVSSPTFTIVNEYLGQRELYHFDMYRLGSAGELFDIGWEDYLNRGGVCAVEWSENVEEAFEGDELRVTIERTRGGGRCLTFDGLDEPLAEALRAAGFSPAPDRPAGGSAPAEAKGSGGPAAPARARASGGEEAVEC